MIKPENLGRVLTAALFVILAFALVLILLDYPTVGIVICILTLILNRARGIFKVRIWLLRTLCGINITPQEAETYRAQIKAQKGKSAVRTPFGDTRKAATPPKPDGLSEAEIARRIADNRRSGILLKRVWPIGTPDIPKSWPQNSWIGGLPHLAPGLDWPRHGTTNLPLHFLSQIDLSEMPHPQGEPKLPDTGTLYFFADISEDLDWDEGGDSSDGAVLYTPKPTRDLPQTPEPDDMPVMHHQGDLLTGHSYSHLGVHQTHAPKWPVSPQVIDTWDIKAIQPLGQYDAGLAEALQSATDAAFGGVFEEHDWVTLPKLISRTLGLIDAPDDMIIDGPSGVPTQFYQKPIPEGKTVGLIDASYDPTALGGTLPFCGTGARVLLADLRFTIEAKTNQARDSIRYAEKRGEDPTQMTRATLRDGETLLALLDKTIPAFDAAPANKPLGKQRQAKFDALITEIFVAQVVGGVATPNTLYLSEWAPLNALVKLVAMSVTDPALRACLPDSMIDVITHRLAPKRGQSEHMMLGNKGMATNPTAGTGVRLAQFGSDYALQWMFCDCGIVDFWISEDDLAALNFDRAWAATAGG